MAKTAVQNQKRKLKDLAERCKTLFLQHLPTWFLLNIVLILSIYKQLDKLKKITTWIYFFPTFLNADIFLYFGCNEKLIVFFFPYLQYISALITGWDWTHSRWRKCTNWEHFVCLSSPISSCELYCNKQSKI